MNFGAVLDAAVAGQGLFVRCVSLPGYVVSVDALRQAGAADPSRGELIIPSPSQVPESAVPREGSGTFRVCDDDLRAVTTAIQKRTFCRLLRAASIS